MNTNTFEEKLEKIQPIMNKNMISPGKEWVKVAYFIKKDFLGITDYNQARREKDTLNIHIVEMLNQGGYLEYEQTQNIIYKLFSKVFGDDLIIGSVNKITLDSHNNGTYKYYGETVNVCFCPSIECSSKQVLLKFDEYKKLEKNARHQLKGGSLKDSGANFSFKDVVAKAVEKKASDVHIMYGEKFYNISFVISDKLENQREFTMTTEAGLDFVQQLKNDASKTTRGGFNADECLIGQDARIEYDNIGLDGVSARLSFIPDGVSLKKEAVTARILKKTNTSVESFKALGYCENFEEKVKTVSKKQNGLVISSGITGSGKSTLISTILANEIPLDKRVYSIEDPIEYVIPNLNVTQHQIYTPKDEKKAMGFARYAKQLKRSAPKVVNIGEMRKDPELTESIMEMAEAGQLVFTTVHISSAFSIYQSLEQVFKIDTKLSVPIILFSVNQVLVDKLCPHCKIKDKKMTNISRLRRKKDDTAYAYTAPLEKLLEDANSEEFETYVKGEGCEKCNHKGYLGMVPIYEYFSPTVRFKEWVMDFEKFPNRYQIEQKVCDMRIGVNKLDTFCKRLRDGLVDASENVVNAIL